MSEEGSGDLQSRIGLTARSRRRRHVWRWFTVLLVGIAVVVGVMRLRASRPEPGAQYQMDTVERGTLTVTITATGELKSLTQVNIGTEISGIVESVNVDFNSPVRVGQILAAGEYGEDRGAGGAGARRASVG